MESVERLQKYVGKIKGSRSCPSNPCFTVNNIIEIANYVADLKAQLAAANAEIERLSAELAPLGLPAPFIAKEADHAEHK